jgi:hypothetical protein
MKKKYLLAGSAFVAFLMIITIVFIPEAGIGNEQTRSTFESINLESPHNYYNNMDEVYSIHVPGAEWIKAKFYKYDLERRYDYVYIYDGNGDYVTGYTGRKYNRWTPECVGDTLYVRLVTDSDITKWGFQIVEIEYQGGSAPPPDTEAPIVSIDAPANGATVGDVVSVDVTATDNIGVTATYLSIDGGSYFATSFPYDWDTNGLTDGDYTLKAAAEDAAGNIGYSALITVTVDNTVEPPPVLDGDEHFLGAVAGGEQDWYEIYAYPGAIAVSVSWGTSVDIDCYINTVESTTGYLARGYTTANPETCSYQVSTAGYYYIGVVMYTSSAVSTDYDCHVTWQAEEPPPPPPPSGDKWAVIVGISDYKAISDLSYCDEDATDWYNYLVNTMGYATSNIRVLGDGHTSNYPQYDGIATEANYRAALTWVADNVVADQTVVFATSGHGSGDGRGSSFLCAWDCYSGESGYDGDFYDTEVDDYVGAIASKGADVLFFIDHCYAGGMGPEILNLGSSANTLTLTTCTEDGYGWDDSTHQNGMWTYWFLEAGLIGQFNSDPGTSMESAFQWAHDNYPKSGGDEPQIFDGSGTLFYL